MEATSRMTDSRENSPEPDQVTEPYQYHPRSTPINIDPFAMDQLWSREDEGAALDHMFRMHIYFTLGGVLMMKENMIIWMDIDQDEVPPPEMTTARYHKVEKQVTPRCYFGGGIKEKKLHYKTLHLMECTRLGEGVNQRWCWIQKQFAVALNCATQRRRLLWPMDPRTLNGLRKVGLVAGVKRLEAYGPTLCLELDHQLIMEGDTRVHLQEWLQMDKTECDLS